jgi:CheY-like chemotaxis protein
MPVEQRLPATEQCQAGQEPPSILVVDNSPDVCWRLEHALLLFGCAVTTMTKGAEAAELVVETPHPAASMDALLPELDGLKLAALIRRRSPCTAVVLTSGLCPDGKAITKGVQRDLSSGFRAKPFCLDPIRQMAR